MEDLLNYVENELNHNLKEIRKDVTDNELTDMLRLVIVSEDKQYNVSMVGMFICNYFIEKGKGIIPKEALLANAAKETLLFAVQENE